MTSRVGPAWSRIARWMAENAPAAAAAVQPGADAHAVNEIVDAVGEALPHDLTAWWKLVNGFSRDVPPIHLIPVMYFPLTVGECLAQWRFWSDIEREDLERDVEYHPGRFEAGTQPMYHSEHLFPFAHDESGDALFVDLRPGERHGCVLEWTIGQPFTPAPLWSGISPMLEDIADAMEEGTIACSEHVREMSRIPHPAWPYVVRPTADRFVEWASVHGKGATDLGW